jgi:hypothetical protein
LAQKLRLQYPVASVGPAVVIGFVGGMRVKVAVTSGGSSMLHGGWPCRSETVCRRSSGISPSYQSLTCSPRYTTSPAPPSLASAASSSVGACHRRSSRWSDEFYGPRAGRGCAGCGTHLNLERPMPAALRDAVNDRTWRTSTPRLSGDCLHLPVVIPRLIHPQEGSAVTVTPHIPTGRSR